MKKSLFFILLFSIIFLLSSCVMVNDIFKFDQTYVEDSIDFYKLSDDAQFDIVRIMATAYNAGANNDLTTITSLMNSSTYTYDDYVLAYFKFFTGKTDKIDISKGFYDVPNRIPEITNYIKNITINEEDNSDSNWLIDLYDFDIPRHNFANSALETYSNEDFLIERIKYFIMNYSSIFPYWFDEYYPDETITDSLIDSYARFLVRLAKTYSRSNIQLDRLLYTSSSDLYPSTLTLKNIPVELIISIMAQESHFFPGSYRGEVDSSDRIQTISFGLTHFLLDADFTYLGGDSGIIGNNVLESYNFNQISKYYLGNDDLKENVFNDWHLLSVKGNVLYNDIFLEMIWNKFIKPKYIN